MGCALLRVVLQVLLAITPCRKVQETYLRIWNMLFNKLIRTLLKLCITYTCEPQTADCGTTSATLIPPRVTTPTYGFTRWECHCKGLSYRVKLVENFHHIFLQLYANLFALERQRNKEGTLRSMKQWNHLLSVITRCFYQVSIYRLFISLSN